MDPSATGLNLDKQLHRAERFAVLPRLRRVDVAGGRHLWVGESQTRRVLEEIVAAVNPSALPLPTTWPPSGA